MNIWRLVGPLALSGACTPLGDLDATGRGATGSAAGAAAGGTASASAGSVGEPVGSAPPALPNGGTSGDPGPTSPSADGGDAPADDAGNGGEGFFPESGGASPAGEAGARSDGPFPDLPNEQLNSPVQGVVRCIEASYSGQPSFEVLTPTAQYVLLRRQGSIVSIIDLLSRQHLEWLGFSDYRPRRVAGIISGDRLPNVVTTLDAGSVTAQHVRLRSESAAGDWLWVWDFYATQATLTISRAPEEFGFTYRGTPGGQLDDGDQLVFASGEARSVKSSFSEALPETAGWLYFPDPVLGHSLFLIQHVGDELPERYDALDGDSATLLFGSGHISRLPNRFSLGLVDSTNHAAVTRRAEFVMEAVR